MFICYQLKFSCYVLSFIANLFIRTSRGELQSMTFWWLQQVQRELFYKTIRVIIHFNSRYCFPVEKVPAVVRQEFNTIISYVLQITTIAILWCVFTPMLYYSFEYIKVTTFTVFYWPEDIFQDLEKSKRSIESLLCVIVEPLLGVKYNHTRKPMLTNIRLYYIHFENSNNIKVTAKTFLRIRFL